jgi:DNA-binding HxlR family transcriptional regulator
MKTEAKTPPPESTSTTCPLSLALGEIGDRWILLILREIFEGRTSFVRMVESLGIARNILSDRLHQLQEHKIIFAMTSKQDQRQIKYRLTPKGADLIAVLATIRLWGEKWAGEGHEFGSSLVEAKSKSALISVGFKTQDLNWIEPHQISLSKS